MNDKPKALPITPAMIAAIAAPMPNFHALWREYAGSSFRREWLAAWAGDDVEKQLAVQDILDGPRR